MRALQWLLVLGCIASIASAVNGVQSFSYDSATGSHTAYFAGWDRLWAVASALVCGIGAWGIYRRAPIVWPIGWVALLCKRSLVCGRGCDHASPAALWLGRRYRCCGWCYPCRRLLGHLVAAAPRVLYSWRTSSRLVTRPRSFALVCRRHGCHRAYFHFGGGSNGYISPVRPNQSLEPTAGRCEVHI